MIRIQRWILGIGIGVWSISYYAFTPGEVAAKYMILALLLIAVITWNRIELSTIPTEPVLVWLGLFWLWLVGKSMVQGWISGGLYTTYFENAGGQFLLYLLEVFGGWGWLFLGLVLFSTSVEKISIRRASGLILFAGIAGGLGPYLFQQRWITETQLTIFSNQYSMSALLLNLFIPFSLAYLVDPLTSSRGRLVAGTGFSLGVGTVFLTQSRGGFVSLASAIGLFMILLLVREAPQKTLLGATGILLGTVVVIGGLYSGLNETPIDRLENIENVSSFSGRSKVIWPDTWWLIKQKPVVGHAVASYRTKIVDTPYQGRPNANAHHTVLQVMYDGGLIGFLLFFGFCFVFLRKTIRAGLRRDPQSIYYLALFASFVGGVLIHGIVESYPYGLLPFYLGLFFLIEPERSKK